jgi:tetratricopeptide (TPR) repeat protein/DNA-binding SARP family transcriptional activator
MGSTLGTQKRGGALVDVELGILGRTWLRAGGRRVLDWGKRRERGIVAALATQPNRTMSVETLLEWVWARDDQIPLNPASTFYTYARRIRAALRRANVPIELIGEFGGYRLGIDKSLIDYFAFNDLIDEARAAGLRHDHRLGCEIALRAIGLWQGRPLDDLDTERADNWRRSVLDNVWIPAHNALIEGRLALGEFGSVVRMLDELQIDHADNLTLAKRRLQALYGLDRFNEAKTYYFTFRRRMRDNFDDESAEEIRSFHERLAPTPQPDAEVAAVAHARRQVPDQIPHPPPDFTGRETELAQLDSAYTQLGGVIVLSGLAGGGKTALAVYWAHRLRRLFPDGNLHVNLNGFSHGPRVEPTEVIDAFLMSLGFSADPITTPQARAARLRELIAGRRLLVLLDNARDSAHVEPLLHLLNGCLVIVTSRQRLIGLSATHGARSVTVGPLSICHGVELLTRRIGARATGQPEAVQRLASLCSGVPLALNLVAERVAVRPGASLTAFAEQLQVRQALLRIGAEGDGSQACLEAVFACSYQALAPPDQRLFRLLGLHPGAEFGIEVAAAFAGESIADTNRGLDVLVGAHLLEQPGELDRYQFHDLLRDYAAHQAAHEEFGEQRRAGELRMLSFYLHSSYNADRMAFPYWPGIPMLPVEDGVVAREFGDDQEAVLWCLRERVNLSAAVRAAADGGHHHYAWRLPHTMAPTLTRHGYYPDTKGALEIAVSSARQCGDEDGEAASANDLGLLHLNLDDHESARPFLETAMRMAEHTGNATGMTVALRNLGRLEMADGRPAAAIELYERSLEIARRIDNRMVQAAALHGLGEVLCSQRQYDRAIKSYQQSLWIREEIGNVRGQGETLTSLGSLHADRGEYSTALAYCRQAILLLDQIHDLVTTRVLCLLLAQLHDQMNDREQAVEFARRAVDLARRIGSADAVAVTLDFLGQLWFAAGCHEEASQAWHSALVIFRDREDGLRVEALETKLAALEQAATAVPSARREAERSHAADSP